MLAYFVGCNTSRIEERKKQKPSVSGNEYEEYVPKIRSWDKFRDMSMNII
jgi:hypothetical protein